MLATSFFRRWRAPTCRSCGLTTFLVFYEAISKRPRVLVVEDDAFVVEAIVGALDGEYSVATAATVAGAVCQLRETEFGAVLLDCLLPDSDCAEVITAAELRKVPGHPDVQ